jgi:hypothetical protein
MKTLLLTLCLGIMFLFPSELKAQSVTQVSQTVSSKQTTSIKASPGRLNVVYDSTTNDLQDVFYQQSVSGGVSYTSPVKVSQTSSINFSPDVAVSPSGAIYVVWSGLSNQTRAILLSRSTNNGASFSSPIVISTSNQTAQVPKININRNGGIFVAYFDGNGATGVSGDYVVSSNESSFSVFTKPKLVSNPREFALDISVLFDSQLNTYIVYGDVSRGVTYLVTSSNGRDFTSPLPIVAGPTGFGTGATAAIDAQDNIYIAGNAGFGTGIYFTVSRDKGRTFSTPNIIVGSQFGTSPSIALSRSGITVAWNDFTTNLRIAGAKSTNGGNTFGSVTTISTNTTNRSFNVTATSNQGIGAFSWVSEVGEPGGNSNVFSLVFP